MAMDWAKLLSTKRVRQLEAGTGPSKRMPGDDRSEFDHDHDRIIYSTPFRRLQDKTQVFPLEPNDSVRTRLTHSLEVSRAARGLAENVCRRMVDDGRIDRGQAKSIEAIAAACGLLHDLGNPPFGHSGEIAIREWFRADEELSEEVAKASGPHCREGQARDDFLLFEGNAQTLRLVTRLQILSDYYGLNLTCGTLSAACKYIAASDEVTEKVHEKSKTGYFASESDLIQRLRDETGSGDARNPIAFLVEAADDCVYNIVDLEDGVTKGILSWNMLKEELLGGDEDPAVAKECIRWAKKRVEQCEAGLEGRAKDNALVQYFRVWAIGKSITASAQAFMDHYDEIIEGTYHRELVANSAAGPLIKSCRRINLSRVYCSDETLKLELMGRRVIQDLLGIYWEGAAEGDDRTLFGRKAYNLLSDNYRRAFKRRLDEGDLPELYCRIQLVTDYVCGMTDTFAVCLHRRLTNG